MKPHKRSSFALAALLLLSVLLLVFASSAMAGSVTGSIPLTIVNTGGMPSAALSGIHAHYTVYYSKPDSTHYKVTEVVWHAMDGDYYLGGDFWATKSASSTVQKWNGSSWVSVENASWSNTNKLSFDWTVPTPTTTPMKVGSHAGTLVTIYQSLAYGWYPNLNAYMKKNIYLPTL